jgi:hypothetical protein
VLLGVFLLPLKGSPLGGALTFCCRELCKEIQRLQPLASFFRRESSQSEENLATALRGEKVCILRSIRKFQPKTVEGRRLIRQGYFRRGDQLLNLGKMLKGDILILFVGPSLIPGHFQRPHSGEPEVSFRKRMCPVVDGVALEHAHATRKPFPPNHFA